jgi:RNA polymerase sigma-70 factor, ECF subfamily
MNADSSEITRLLALSRTGDKGALEELTPLVYHHLHFLASHLLTKERSSHTLQPTALLHEAFMRLMGGSQPDWNNRVHFYAFASRVMRQVLIDYARRRSRVKRAGALVPLDDVQLAAPAPSDNLLALNEALERLASVDPRKARILELHYFGGLGVAETGQVLEVSEKTVRREMRLAEAWLHRELEFA